MKHSVLTHVSPLDTKCDFTSKYVYFLLSDTTTGYWTGGNDLATRDRWVWASTGNRIYPYVNWQDWGWSNNATGREAAPEDDEGRCLAMEPTELRWVKAGCEEKRFFVCEKGELN